MQFRNAFFPLAPLIILSAAIFTMSQIPSDKLPDPGFWQWDKFAHVIEYFIYSSAVLFFAEDPGKKYSGSKKVFIVILISATFSASDELHQAFVPGRTCSVYDFFADSCGMAICLALRCKLGVLYKLVFDKYYAG